MNTCQCLLVSDFVDFLPARVWLVSKQCGNRKWFIGIVIHIGPPLYCFLKTKRPQPIVNATPTHKLFRPGWKHQIAMMYCCGKPASPTPMLQVQSSRVYSTANTSRVPQRQLPFILIRHICNSAHRDILDNWAEPRSWILTVKQKGTASRANTLEHCISLMLLLLICSLKNNFDRQKCYI